MSVMDEYIKIVQDAITKYLKLVFERKFNKQICDSYIKTYIDVRYYNVNERGNHRTLRKEILESLKEKKKRLIVDNKSKQLLIENMEMFFIYVLYIDKVTPYKTIDDLVKNICRLRVKILKKANLRGGLHEEKTYYERFGGQNAQAFEQKANYYYFRGGSCCGSSGGFCSR